LEVPESCCILTGDPLSLRPEDPSCIINPTHSNSYLATGCYQKFSITVKENVNIVIVVVVVVAATQLLAIIFALCLCRAVGRERDYHYKY
jgi:hypothetical protein